MWEEDELIECVEVLLKLIGQLNKSEMNPSIQKSKTEQINNIKKDIELYKSINNNCTSEETRKKDELFYKITDYLDELYPE